MTDPDPAVFLDCYHVEHPQGSGYCQTTDCPHRDTEHPGFGPAEYIEWLMLLDAKSHDS